MNVWSMQSEILSIEMDQRILVKRRYQLHIYLFFNGEATITKLILGIINAKDSYLKRLYIKIAFPYGDLKKDIYMK
jgi:hypothetical protein